MDSRKVAKRRAVSVQSLELDKGEKSLAYCMLYSPMIENRPKCNRIILGDSRAVRNDSGRKAYHISLFTRELSTDERVIGEILEVVPLGVANSLRTLARKTRECAKIYGKKEAKRLEAEFYMLGPKDGPCVLG